MTSRLSIVQIGLGTMGRNHAKALAALSGKLDTVTLAAAFDPDPAARDHAEALGLALTDDLAQALSGAQAAVVASPTSTHAQVLQAVGASGAACFS